ncbi:MAG TPA: cryptochrome/photolyase family protein, partial [Burkholderiaceae bacterium]|nr:cryptochrome/photolyase family protein [Burkholderiaceae bacterium]
MRDLVLVLGDQLSFESPAFANFDAAQDRVLMIEARGEGEYVWSHKARIALFLSAMRHFCNDVHRRGWPYTYVRLDDDLPHAFDARLTAQLHALKPQRVLMVEPGEWRMLKLLQDACSAARTPLELLDDTHFMCSRSDFAQWARNKRELRMEFFYREMRRRHRVLMDGK